VKMPVQGLGLASRLAYIERDEKWHE
jgi:hypothetical protein